MRETTIRLLLISFILTSSVAMAGSIDHIQKTGEIGLCAHPDQMPYSKRTGGPKGFQIDIAKAIAEKLDVSLNVSWIIRKRHAKKTGCDLYAGVARLGSGDSKYVLVSDPYFHLEFKLVTLVNGKNIKGIRDLESMVVGVSPGSVASRALNVNKINLAVRYRDEASRLQAVADGLIDAAVVTNISSGWFQKEHGQKLQVLDAEKVLGVKLNYDYALGLRKADENTRNAFNKVLLDMKNDGTLLKVLGKYGFPVI